ncbi:MAG: ABC transporter permease subunit [Myxococcales bacterium]|nr:ABC transporter permease subunit [Myxococcales bacterium]MCB9641962.1 ABC transporter permease subunit [Myxococcales bacterium]
MNQRVFDLVRAVIWAGSVVLMGYLIPHASIANKIFNTFLGKTPTTSRWVFFVLALVLSGVLLWMAIRALLASAVDLDNPDFLGGLITGLLQGTGTVLTATLVFTLCRTGDQGTLRHFVFDLLNKKFESRVLFDLLGLFGLVTVILMSNRAIRAIFFKEFRIYFTTPIAYAVMMLFTLIAGFFFQGAFDIFNQYATLPYQMKMRYAARLNLNDFVFSSFLQTLGTILIFLAPMLTMRLISEERKNRTYELLMTAPITSTEIVLGKFLSAFGVLSILIGLTFMYPLLVGITSKGAFEWAPVFTGYFGLFLLAGTFAAIGLFSSTLTENQVIAAVVTFGVLLLMWIMNWAASNLGDGMLREVVSYLAITKHLTGFSKGIIEVRDVVYYLSLIVFANLMAHRMVESQRWR